MKKVVFAKPMAPHGVGESRLVPDHVAERLEKSGAISSSVPWPSRPATASVPEKPKRPVMKPVRPVGVADRRIAE